MTAKTFNEAWEEVKASASDRTCNMMTEVEQLVGVINGLSALRIEKGLTQEQLARICGLRQSAISRIESLRMIPRLDTIIKIAVALGVKLSIEEGSQDEGC